MFLELRHFDSTRGLDLKSRTKCIYIYNVTVCGVFARVCSVFARVSVRCVFVKLAKSKSRHVSRMQNVSGKATCFFMPIAAKDVCFVMTAEKNAARFSRYIMREPYIYIYVICLDVFSINSFWAVLMFMYDAGWRILVWTDHPQSLGFFNFCISMNFAADSKASTWPGYLVHIEPWKLAQWKHRGARCGIAKCDLAIRGCETE